MDINLQASPAPAPVPELRLAVRGLLAGERQLLEGLVKVSQRDTRRRTQRLALVDEPHAHTADMVIIDARDPAAMAWAQAQPWLAGKATIWIDAASVPAGHTLARRPVQWPVLPILLARAMEQGPAAAAQAHAAPIAINESPNPTPRAGRAQILLVDDSALVRMQLRPMLQERGYQVAEADSARSAIGMLDAQAFDCVLMDVLMPGMDGYDGCREIKSRRRGARVPVVMLTSKSSPFDRIRGKMAGCDAWLTKPVDPAQLGEVIARLLHDAHGAHGARDARVPAAGIALPMAGSAPLFSLASQTISQRTSP